MKNHKHVYAIIRVDNYQFNKDSFTVKEIVFSVDEAEKEVIRLSNINKNCYYYWQLTRIKDEN